MNIGSAFLRRRAWRVIAALGVASSGLSAQSSGTLAAERARLVEITGDTTQLPSQPDLVGDLGLAGWPLLRRVDWSRLPLRIVRPDLRVVWNSALPYSLNDGALWAGRGLNVSMSGGLAWTQRLEEVGVRLVLAPMLYFSENRPFQVFPNRTPGRSPYANPFHGAGTTASLDLPHRFGNRHLLGIDAGRSELAVEWPAVTVGVTASNEWWGPGIRNAIILSNNAAGIPRWYARTTRPARTVLGGVEAKLIGGTLTRSLFFGQDESEHRTISGILIQLRPAFDSTLTFGFSRVVYAPVGPEASELTSTLARSFDAITRWENLSGPQLQRSDQIGAVFARWIFPAVGLEVYGEWARMDLPRNATELLTAPHYTGGWTFGFNWAHARAPGRYLRLQSEVTYLEQSRVFGDRPSADFYSGQASPHGYTQRGQIIGAAIGPGASSQWIAVDWLVPRWQVGGFVGRIRWDNDALYREPAPTFWDHDVSMLAGLRGGWRTALSDFGVEITAAKRYNYLFQNAIVRAGRKTIDVDNLTVTLTATPR